MSESNEKIKKDISVLVEEMREITKKAISNNIEQHNIVFRQMASLLILVGGIFLAFSTQILTQLSNSSNAVKLLALLLVIFLNISILLGILQHVMEASFFRKYAISRRKLLKDLRPHKPDSAVHFFGSATQLELMMGDSTKRWPTYIQMLLLSVSVILLSVIAGIKLYS